jgi:hypothetical protein
MNQMVRVLDREIEKVTYRDRPVVTLSQVDELHGRPADTAGATFRRHKDKMIEHEDYFDLPYSEWAPLVQHQMPDQRGGHRGRIILLTETGYLMVIKPFTDERAWAVQRILVSSYFNQRIPPGHVAVQAEKMIDLQQIYIERLELQSAGFGPRRGLPWSEADIQKIFAMKAKGKSHKSIGEHFGRSKEAVDKIVKKHKQRFDAAAERQRELLFG